MFYVVVRIYLLITDFEKVIKWKSDIFPENVEFTSTANEKTYF